MRFSKDHIRFIRNQYAINKAFCHFSLVLIAAAIIFFGFYGAYDYLSHPQSKGEESRDYSECRDVHAENDLCAMSSSESAEDPESNDNETQSPKYVPNTFIKDKRDLNAQEGMWRATNLLGYLTVIQAFIALITVGVVGYTLVQTREILRETKETTRQAELATRAANETTIATKRATELELRPYFIIKKVENINCGNLIPVGSGIGDLSHPYSLEAKVVIKNIGKTPARNFSGVFSHGGKYSFDDFNSKYFNPASDDIWGLGIVRSPYKKSFEYLAPGQKRTLKFFATYGIEGANDHEDDIAEGCFLYEDITTTNTTRRRIKFRIVVGGDDNWGQIVSDDMVDVHYKNEEA